MKVQFDGFSTVFFIFGLRKITRFQHLAEHHVAALLAALGIADGIKERRILAQTDKQSRFGYRQIARLFIKIGVGCSLDSHCSVQEIEVVQVQCDNLFLGKFALELDGSDPLDRLLEHTTGG